MPGAGKTIMAAVVIDHLLRSQHVADEPAVFISSLSTHKNRLHTFASLNLVGSRGLDPWI
jgi:hypothetical protein